LIFLLDRINASHSTPGFDNRQYMQFVSDVPLWRYDARLIYVPLPFYKIWGLLKIVYSKILQLLK